MRACSRLARTLRFKCVKYDEAWLILFSATGVCFVIKIVSLCMKEGPFPWIELAIVLQQAGEAFAMMRAWLKGSRIWPQSREVNKTGVALHKAGKAFLLMRGDKYSGR
jgi:hypothetical protein